MISRTWYLQRWLQNNRKFLFLKQIHINSTHIDKTMFEPFVPMTTKALNRPQGCIKISARTTLTKIHIYAGPTLTVILSMGFDLRSFFTAKLFTTCSVVISAVHFPVATFENSVLPFQGSHSSAVAHNSSPANFSSSSFAIFHPEKVDTKCPFSFLHFCSSSSTC